MEYREVKRKAKVGERIRFPEYPGLTFVATKRAGNRITYAYWDGVEMHECAWMGWTNDGEYVVLEPIEETKEENMEVCEAMPTIDYEAENENLRRLCDYQREKHRQLLKAYVNLARYIDICEDGKIRGLEGL